VILQVIIFQACFKDSLLLYSWSHLIFNLDSLKVYLSRIQFQGFKWLLINLKITSFGLLVGTLLLQEQSNLIYQDFVRTCDLKLPLERPALFNRLNLTNFELVFFLSRSHWTNFSFFSSHSRACWHFNINSHFSFSSSVSPNSSLRFYSSSLFFLSHSYRSIHSFSSYIFIWTSLYLYSSNYYFT